MRDGKLTTKEGKLRIAVVGAGIGGLTAVLSLLRDGHEVTCFERATELRELGAGIQIGPNAARLLRRLGLGAALDRVACRPEVIEIRRWDDGRILRRVDAGRRLEEMFGAPYYTLHRADLHAALYAAVPEGIVRLGARCAEACTSGGKATLRFEDGETFEADAVVGADGLRSAVRECLRGDEARFSGKMACRVLVPAEAVPDLAEPKAVRMWLGPGKHVVSYPVRSGTLLNLAGAVEAPAGEGESWTREGEVGEMRAAFAGWHEDVHRVLDAAETTLRLPLYDRAPLARIGDGRVTLLGDAAHPMLPFFAQGAAQAVEDACVLARCLSGERARDVEHGFRRYEAARNPRVAEVQRRSVRNGRLFQLPNGVRQWGRDLILRRLRLESFEWLYGYDAETACP